jgi:hypothetical protein
MEGRVRCLLFGAALVAGCGTTVSDGGPAGGGGAASSPVGGAGGQGSGLACLELTTEADCEAAGCVFTWGQLFSPPSNCTETSPIGVCISRGTGATFDQSTLKYRDISEGRIVIEPEMDDAAEGYTDCGHCQTDQLCDWCQCKGP